MVGWFWVFCALTLGLALMSGRRWVLWLPVVGALALVLLVFVYEPDKLFIAVVGATLYASLLAAAAVVVMQLRRQLVARVWR